MTILLGFRREGFVVLAADQLMCSLGGGTDLRRSPQRKIITHPGLPLAVATVGLRSVGRSGVPVPILVGTVLEGVSREEACFEVVAAALTRKILPYLHQMREVDTEHLKELQPRHVSLVVGVAGARGAELGFVECRREATIRQEPEIIAGPKRVLDFLTRVGAWKGSGIDVREALREHAVRVVRTGIDEDARLGERDRLTGGDVDVVVVDADGTQCHFVPLDRTKL